MTSGIAKIFGYVMNLIYEGLQHLGVTNLGVTIIIFAAFVQLIMFPFIYIQQKKSKITQYIQPEINKVNKKYKGKKDQESMMKMQQETQAIYKKYGTSATSGCLPMFVQLFILYGVIRVIYNIPNYISSIGNVYGKIADPIVSAVKADSGLADKLTEIAKNLSATRYFKDATSVDDIISLIYRFKDETWDTARELFAGNADVINSINEFVPQLRSLNNFTSSINISEYPNQHGFSIYLLIPVLAAFFQWLQTKTVKQPEMPDGQEAMGGYMKVMMNTMPLMSLFFYYMLPCGIGLYWAAKAFFNVIQQVGFNIYFDHVSIEKIIEKQKEKASKSNKKTLYDRMMEASGNAAESAGTNPTTPDGSKLNKSKDISNIAKMSVKNIDFTPVERTSKIEVNGEDVDTSKKKKNKNDYGPIGDIARMFESED